MSRLFVLLLLYASAAAAQPFPEITASERALTAVPGHPQAPAVVLFKRAELRLADSWAGTPSTLDVHVRTKVLAESGKGFGQVAVEHSDSFVLERFAARTVLPDGRVVPLSEDAIFREESSRARQRYVTKAALPAVTVGAILDYRYRLRWSSVFLQPWTFDGPIPTLISELVYHKPIGMVVEHHLRGGPDFLTQSDATARGEVVRVWLENLPPVLEEPYSFPFADLAHQVLISPQMRSTADGRVVPLLDSWRTVCRRYEESSYAPLRRKARQVRKKASQLAAEKDVADRGAGGRIAALHGFVRDEIETGGGGIETAAESLDAVLAAGRGTYAEKALLLQAMLAAVKVPARLVWAIDWREGFVDLEVVNPGWFEKVLVLAESGTFLDPGEAGLAAGRLAPTNEGTQALVFDVEEPRVLELPLTPATGSRRHAVLDLAVDDGGRVAGRGRLTLTGHQAWFYLGRLATAEALRDTWRQWLELQHEGYAIADVEVAESYDEQRVDLSWTMTRHQELVLGDEVSLLPSRPLGPIRQRYTIPPESRRTAVQVSFADGDEIELRLAWPASWEVDLLPDAVEHASNAGTARATVEVDAAGRRLTYRRLFEITGVRYEPGEPYARLRELYIHMERHDAQSVVLVRED